MPSQLWQMPSWDNHFHSGPSTHQYVFFAATLHLNAFLCWSELGWSDVPGGMCLLSGEVTPSLLRQEAEAGSLLHGILGTGNHFDLSLSPAWRDESVSSLETSLSFIFFRATPHRALSSHPISATPLRKCRVVLSLPQPQKIIRCIIASSKKCS